MGKLEFCCRRQSRGTKQAYIKISESEIADDYPEPLQYDKVSRLPPVCPTLLTRPISQPQIVRCAGSPSAGGQCYYRAGAADRETTLVAGAL